MPPVKRIPGLSTRAAHPPGPETGPSEPLAPPITLASVHRFPDLDTLGAASRGELAREGFYRRYGHANGRQLEECVASLEGSEDALACTSGMAAAHAMISALAARGGLVVAARDLYGGTTSLLRQLLPRLGVELRFLPLEDMERALPSGTKLALAETISNPLVRVADLSRLAKSARAAGARLLIDNTFASPVLCRPLEWGADVVWHSGTKFLNGHGDAMSGIVCGSKELLRPMRKLAILVGGTVSPLDAWLTLRGIKTVGVRVERASRNAALIARRLGRHPKVLRVHYPGAQRYVSPGRGPVLSFEVRGGVKGADRFVRACRLLELAPSLGDVSTTLSHPARSSHAGLTPAERAAIGVTDGLLRVSTGIEDSADILEDFEQALKKV